MLVCRVEFGPIFMLDLLPSGNAKNGSRIGTSGKVRPMEGQPVRFLSSHDDSASCQMQSARVAAATRLHPLTISFSEFFFAYRILLSSRRDVKDTRPLQMLNFSNNSIGEHGALDCGKRRRWRRYVGGSTDCPWLRRSPNTKMPPRRPIVP